MSKVKDYSKEEVLKIVKEQDIKIIRLQFTDILGAAKNVAITANQLKKALENKCTFDGSSIEGFARIEESDMLLYPDLSTFMLYPFGDQNCKIARLICDIHTPESDIFVGDPRYILKRQLAKAKCLGFDFLVGPECEFFLFELGYKGRATTNTNDTGGYFEMGPADKGSMARREISLTLEEMGFEIEASHHECAKGQHEIDFKYSQALIAADDIITFKHTVRSIAENYNLCASFMPKPLEKEAGSGMHINMSLENNGNNAFYDRSDTNGLSKIAYNFIAGIIKHIKGITAILNPTVNSYKRLVAGFEAPIHIAWSLKNRSPLIRIPTAKKNSTRIELRSPDCTANPYLALALCLAAGLEGIEKNLLPPKEIETNTFELSYKQLEQLNIEKIPSDLNQAIGYMKNDEFVRDVLGEHVFSKYISCKEKEWQEYSSIVSKWELDKYLNK